MSDPELADLLERWSRPFPEDRAIQILTAIQKASAVAALVCYALTLIILSH